MYNRDFNAALISYSERYENSLHFSPRFQHYASQLADRLIDRYGLRNKTIVEIGCGKGEFLTMLCAQGSSRGVGFDRSYEPGRDRAEEDVDVTYIKDYYGDPHAHKFNPDFIVCRHVLEHIAEPLPFLKDLAKTLQGSRATVYFEVPNGEYMLREQAIWDLIYEHFSYFTKKSLAKLFCSAGFSINDVGESFDGQYLYIEAYISGERHNDTDMTAYEITQHATTFAAVFHRKVEHWQARLRAIVDDNARAVLWGTGAKGVAFLNMISLPRAIDCAIDVNPHKHGKYVPGSGHRVIAPESLAELKPDYVVVMNPVYRREIREVLMRLGVGAEVIDA